VGRAIQKSFSYTAILAQKYFRATILLSKPVLTAVQHHALTTHESSIRMIRQLAATCHHTIRSVAPSSPDMIETPAHTRGILTNHTIINHLVTESHISNQDAAWYRHPVSRQY
jgi:hypothetical protein